MSSDLSETRFARVNRVDGCVPGHSFTMLSHFLDQQLRKYGLN